MSAPAPISVLIPAKNEAGNLPACLASCAFCDEVVVVDSGSTDATAALAAQAGARVVEFRWDGRFPKKKNWALAQVPWRNEWVFILDA
ncbi:MAG: glycosyltransferase, partial [Opitutales bacterium]